MSDEQNLLYDFQREALNELSVGKILCGSYGSGKSRTSLAWYFEKNGGVFDRYNFKQMEKPRDLYIITTAKKRNELEWEKEFIPFQLSSKPDENFYKNKVVVDSWQNVGKYKFVTGADFIFDEDHVTGKGVWVDAFYEIAKSNDWIILSATPGDTYEQFIPVFVANGFYKNRTQFLHEHAIFNRYTPYQKIEGYMNKRKLEYYKSLIIVPMDFLRKTKPEHITIWTDYDKAIYKQLMRTRFDIWNEKPFENAAGLCYGLRKVVNSDPSRTSHLLSIMLSHKKIVVFYNFDYELELLKGIQNFEPDFTIAEYNGHKHESIPKTDKWLYLVNYSSGAEAWNCTETDTMVFFSQTYSYKTLFQSYGRIDRLNTPFDILYYYHFKSRAPIDLAISKSLNDKKEFNAKNFVKW